MTLVYKLFGVPQTFNEFVDKAKRTDKKSECSLGDLHGTVLAKAEMGRDALKEAIQTAEKLQGFGLDVTISGKTLAEAHQAMAEYAKEITEMKEKYGDPARVVLSSSAQQ